MTITIKNARVKVRTLAPDVLTGEKFLGEILGLGLLALCECTGPGEAEFIGFVEIEGKPCSL